MKSLIDEAKEIIEMSLDAQTGKDEYSRKARGWLQKFEAGRQPGGAHHHEKGMSCAACGNDLVCPSCDEG
ncbi:MAG: hypothetical protein ABII06_08860 [Pseudomonadota bacterium]